MLTLLFFARLRELAGTARLEIDDLPLPLPLTELTTQLRARNPVLAEVLTVGRPLRAALNQQMVAHDSVQVMVHDGDELAFFPPVTGG